MSAEPTVLIMMPPWAAGLARVTSGVGPGAVIAVVPAGEQPDAGLLRECAIVFAEFVPAPLAEMPALAWLQLGSAGYEQLAGWPLLERRVRVTNASGVNDAPIAEWCLAMMFMFERDMRRMLANQAAHVWDRSARHQSELRGRRVGILGYGNIGREVARACSVMGMEVWAMARGPIGPRPGHYVLPGTGDPEGIVPHRTFTLAQMAEFLPALDFLVLTLPLTRATRGMIGERELRLLSPTAVLLNPARGPLIEEAALVRALREGWFAGAALDAHYAYPLPPEHPLWDMPNVILTPHISGSSAGRAFLPRVWDLFAANLAHYLVGQPLLNELSPAQLGAVGVR